MLTERQSTVLLELVLTAFKSQRGVTLQPADFDIIIDKPNNNSLCTLYLVTKRRDDHLRIKLYVTNFGLFTNVEAFHLLQEENYGPGANDEVEVANVTLDKIEFSSFYRYLLSPQFAQDIIAATDKVQMEDGSGFVLSETNDNVIQEH